MFFISLILPEFSFFTSNGIIDYMKTCIIGLGNPGDKYKGSRHNAGFDLLDIFVKSNSLKDFTFSKNINAEISENQNIIIVKPHSFMNLSGIVVKKTIKKFGIKPENIIVIHDDIDIEIGKIKISKNRGSAGHKGIDSIIKEIGSKNFTRIRIGILPNKKPTKVDDFVLKSFNLEEKELLNNAYLKILKELNKWI